MSKKEKIKNEDNKIVIKKEKLKLKSSKIKEREKKIKYVKLTLLVMLLFLVILYFLLKIVYGTGAFTISLDPNFQKKSGIVMYEKLSDKEDKRVLKAQRLEFMDNISVKWLPENIHEMGEGPHNGDNYLAYTFYVENKGSETVNYWYEIYIDDVIKNVDEAIRIMIYRNGEKQIYAKKNKTTSQAEENTKPFYSKDEVLVEGRKDFKQGEIDKFTIVIYLEGDDPECVDSLIGGEMKMHMEITEEHIDQNK